VFCWDRDLKGFGLKACKSGKRTFILQARLHGESRRYTKRVYGQPWSPDQAREAALQMLANIAKGVDPSEEKWVKRDLATISELAKRYAGAPKQSCSHHEVTRAETAKRS
jgi:hypothetical protein